MGLTAAIEREAGKMVPVLARALGAWCSMANARTAGLLLL